MESITYRRHPEFKHLFCGDNGEIFSLKYCIFLKHSSTKKGYSVVNTSSRPRPVHRLIMEAFVGKSDLQVDHLNAIKKDNRLCNLEYVTNAENNKRSNKRRTWAQVRGENNVTSKLNNEKVLLIKNQKPKTEIERMALAKDLNVSLSTIKDVLKGKTWKHVTLLSI